MNSKPALFSLTLLLAALPLDAEEKSPRDQAKEMARQQILSTLPGDAQREAGAKSLAQLTEGLEPSARAGAALKVKELIPHFQKDPAALGEIGTVLASLGQADDAKDLAQQLQTKHPGHPAGFLVEAQALARSDPAKAKRLAAKAVALAQTIGDDRTVGVAFSLSRLTRADSKIQTRDIATGAGVDPKTRAGNDRLNATEQQAIAAATQLLNRTQIGEDNILAILPRMSVRRIEAGKDTGLSSENVYMEEVDGKKVYVAVLSKKSLEADMQSLAAHFNGKMGRARFLEANDGQVSSISAKTVEMMQTVWAKAQLAMLSGSRSVACSISDSLCGYVTTLFQGWTGDLDAGKAKGKENQDLIGHMAKSNQTTAPERFQTAAFKSGEGRKDMFFSHQPWYQPQQRETIQSLKDEDASQQRNWRSGR